jgi:methylase of polypeptide subunit release factors
MEGGGTWFGQEYIQVLKQRYPDRRLHRCFEWCAGPGFIGFSLLDHGVCESLCMSDLYEPAIDCIKATVKSLPETWQSQVSAYAMPTVAELPDHERFDLVVANPPHYLECPGDDNYQRLAVDANWEAHKEFYQHISQHLEPNGIILMQENQAGSLCGCEDFRHMIQSNGLAITDTFVSPNFYNQPGSWAQIYYIEIRRKNLK